MYQRSKDRSLMIKQPRACSLDMEIRSSVIGYGIQRSNRDVVFHEHETIEDMEKNVRGTKLTYEGVVDLTPGQTSSKSVTNEAEMSELELGTELEESVIEEEESGGDSDTGGVDQGEKIPPLEEEP